MRKSSYIIQFVLLLGFMTVTNTVKAQWHKWHFGGGVGSLTYYGDLSDKFVNANLQELGYHAYVERLIAKRSGIYWRLESVNGYLLGSDRAPGGWVNGTSSDFDRSLNFRTKIHDVNTSLVFYFGNRSKRERAPFLNAYVRAGIGIGYFDAYGDLKDADGNFYNYWSDGTIRNLPQNAPNSSEANVITRDYDFETNLNELAIEKSFNRFKWQIPVGLGLKMRLGDAVSLILDAQYTYAMTDYLDNVGDSRTRADITDPNVLRAADPTGYIGDRPRNLDKPTGLNDGYLYVSAGLNFNVGKNEKPKFKAPVYYPKTITPVQLDTVIAEEITTEHPLDSIARSLGQTIEKDTTKSAPFITLQKADSDSLFISLFQENHQLWLNKDSLTTGKTIDSVVLVKVPDMEDGYIARYYEKRSTDSLLHKDTSVLLKTDTLQLDLQKRAILHGSTYYPSSQTIANSMEDSINNSDSISFYIQQLRIQLDNLEKQIKKDSTQPNPASSISDTSTKSLELKRDSIRSGAEKKTDSSSLKTSGSDSLNYSPANYSMVVRDTIKKDSLLKASAPKDSIPSQSITAARVIRDTSSGKSDTLKQVVVDTTKSRKDSSQLYQLKQAEIKRQIAELQKQLDESKDTIQPVVSAKIAETDTASKATIEDLKKRIAELENSSNPKADTTYKAPKITTENYQTVTDTINTKKDSTIAKSQTAADSSNKRLEELKSRIVASEKNASVKQDSIPKDSVKTKDKSQSASGPKPDTLQQEPVSGMPKDSVNKTIEDLKKRIAELENTKDTSAKVIRGSKDAVGQKTQTSTDTTNNRIVETDSSFYPKAGSVNSAVDSKKQSKLRTDSKAEKDTLKVSTSTDSSYNNRIEELRKRIDELENTPKPVKDTLKSESRTITDTVRNSVSNARIAPAKTESSPNQDDELRNRIAELEKQIAQQKSIEDSLNKKMNASTLPKQETSPSEKQQEELQKRLNEIENQLKSAQNARAGSTLSPQEQIQYQARIDSLNQVIAMQRMGFGTGNYPAYSSPQQQGIRPVVEPVISIPVNSGSGRERREERRARKAAEKESQAESVSATESENQSTRLTVGSTRDKGPGYFEAKRLKKEGQSDSSENSEVVSDSSEISSDSLAMTVADSNIVSTTSSTVDSTLQAENLWLKDQIRDIQKNQDSLLLILSNLLTRAEPAAQPEQVVEKEIKPQIDSSQIINGILSQPSTKVFFAVGKSALGSQYKTSLDQLANQMKSYPELKLELKGFADPTGNAAANMLLSEKRAQSVKNYLLQVHNISVEKISVLPVGQEDNSSDLSYSRRVEVKLVR